MTRHNINVNDEIWQIAAESGNASAYIEQAVKARYLKELRDAGNAVVAAMPQKEVDDWTALGMSSVDDAQEGRK
ncbi:MULTISPECIES: hypothetical protein [Glycomyces]|jgi:hypothetical protein|uniref:Uncharacterized protein n=2 Tax=Glycomyces TaxID=58113 RepID=A0A9X3PK18_9ACTN|nr:hypothetical protein [Glycomyces lechevalierae]MDA1386931.1 hypothetical protein [Glycomyces lechevalierae]MDR7341596.1 hypothetical protein [Glycomyces lechevalierae]